MEPWQINSLIIIGVISIEVLLSGVIKKIIMKPWQVCVLVVVGVVFIILFLPVEICKPLFFAIVASSAVWVYIDAKKLNIGKYKKTFLSPSTSPFGTAFIVWILWLIAFPMYISYRKKIIDGKVPLKKADFQKTNSQVESQVENDNN